jgi:hypothetical protein
MRFPLPLIRSAVKDVPMYRSVISPPLPLTSRSISMT